MSRVKLTPEEAAEQQRQAEQAALLQQRRAAMRLLKARQARDSLVTFTEFTMPDKEEPDDAELTRYQAQYFHKALAKALEDVEAGRKLRLIITFPPRHGKSELSSKRFPAWYMGRDPYRYVAVCTYNQTFAEDFGKAVRSIMLTPAYRQVFPGCQLKTGSKAADRLETDEGGALFFLGRGGTITGRGADLIIIDDPIKNSEEARSETVRNQLWEWYQNDIKSRFMSDTGAMIIIQTRWHEDDLVGRITDPTNPNYDAEEAEAWEIIDIPAIARDNDVLGRQPGEALWPERFGLEYLNSFKRANPKGFSALYQQQPTPEDGDFFEAHMIQPYKAGMAPTNLRIYAASDHAVGIKQENDKTCLLIVGVDDKGMIWVLDAWWRRAKTDSVVDAMLMLMKKWKPLVWWAESGHISKSIGPFLYRRMMEEKVFVNVVEQVPSKDKVTRAQSIQARMAMGLVRFPASEPWYEDARQEMLKFPQARHDDFCLSADTMVTMADGSARPISGIIAGDFVRTTSGSRMVLGAKCTSQSARVLRVLFSNGQHLVATGNHPIAVRGKGFVNVDALRHGDVVFHERQEPTWHTIQENRRSSSTASIATGAIQTALMIITENIFTERNPVAAFCTDISGKTSTGVSRMGTKSTTSTTTHSTTTCQISNASGRGAIGGIICQSARKLLSTWRTLTASAFLLASGTALMRGAHGIASVVSVLGMGEFRVKWNAGAAGRVMKRIFRRDHGIALTPVVSVIGVEALTDAIPVYNLAVDGDHVFYANGILTHNCDALAHIGLGLERQINAAPVAEKSTGPKVGTLAWVKRDASFRAAQQKRISLMRGM